VTVPAVKQMHRPPSQNKPKLHAADCWQLAPMSTGTHCPAVQVPLQQSAPVPQTAKAPPCAQPPSAQTPLQQSVPAWQLPAVAPQQ